MTEPRRLPYQYAVLRLVPRVERDEFFNVGVVLFCRPRRFLAVRWYVDEQKFAAMAPECDGETIRSYLHSYEVIAAGAADAGPMARLDQSERFHWIASPASTILQPGPIHPGLTIDPAATLDALFERLVQAMPDATSCIDRVT